ncbi:hypothetical protein CCR96_13115 [Halochromatium roseum]|nr:hypothetical protein [Halochromatium roseum]
MYLEIRSIERALEGIVFFDAYIKPYMAHVDSISVINKLFSFAEHTMDFSDYFDQEVTINPEESAQQLKADLSQGKTPETLEKQSLPLVERFPSYFHEDGVTPLKLLLLSRQTIAIQHFMGNTEYTLHDYMLDIVNREIQNQQ